MTPRPHVSRTSWRRKLRLLVPDKPRRRYTIFCGSNTWREWFLAIRLLFSREVTRNVGVIVEFERRFAQLAGTRFAVSFGSGRMALYAILEAFGISDGDEVIIPAFTCVVVPNAILYRGAVPVYVDIEPRTFNVDTSKIEAAITPRTKALYAQHTFGVLCDVARIREIAATHGLVVIEDAALALGSSTESERAGSMGDAALFSTDHTKTIGTLLGGMATTNDWDVAGRLRAIQERSSFLPEAITRRILLTFIAEVLLFSPTVLWIGKVVHRILIKSRVLFYFSDELQTSKPAAYPYPSRLSSALAAIGLRQLDGFAANAAHRRRLTTWLEHTLKWNADWPAVVEGAVPLRYSFLVKDRATFESRFADRWDLGIWFTSVVQCRNEGLDRVCYRDGSCPVAEYVTRHIVNLPTHPRVPLAALQASVAKNLDWIQTQLIRYSPSPTPSHIAP